jgi:hypothetical protein
MSDETIAHQADKNDTVEPEYRNVTAPIGTDFIREFFKNKNITFLVNHTQSRLKGAVFLTYLANLAVPSDVRFDEPISEDEYVTIMDAYLAQRTISKAKTLQLMMAQVILWAKGIPLNKIPYITGVPENHIVKFARKNGPAIMRWLHFVDSSHIFAMSSIKSLKDQHDPLQNGVNVIDDKEFVGHNAVMLYDVPYFTELYFSIPNARYKASYFVRQYEDYMFGNEKFAKFFAVPNNFLANIYEGVASGYIDLNKPEEFELLEGNNDVGSTTTESTETSENG